MQTAARTTHPLIGYGDFARSLQGLRAARTARARGFAWRFIGDTQYDLDAAVDNGDGRLVGQGHRSPIWTQHRPIQRHRG
jgi:hypothetical protein